MKHVLVVWRDGRDIMVSAYYHYLFSNEKGNGPLVKRTRDCLRFSDYDDISTNLPGFIEYMFTAKPHPRFTWADFVNRWRQREEVVFTKYEALRLSPVEELQRIVSDLANQTLCNEIARKIVDGFSFERQSGRAPGQEKKTSFIRKGIVGDWRNQFTKEAREAFDYYAGDCLIILGYEKDSRWVKQDERKEAQSGETIELL